MPQNRRRHPDDASKSWKPLPTRSHYLVKVFVAMGDLLNQSLYKTFSRPLPRYHHGYGGVTSWRSWEKVLLWSQKFRQSSHCFSLFCTHPLLKSRRQRRDGGGIRSGGLCGPLYPCVFVCLYRCVSFWVCVRVCVCVWEFVCMDLFVPESVSVCLCLPGFVGLCEFLLVSCVWIFMSECTLPRCADDNFKNNNYFEMQNDKDKLAWC